MKALVAAAFLAVAFAGTSAHAASLTNKSYGTAKAAALAGAAYRLDKGVGYGAYKASDLKIRKTIDKTPPVQKYSVMTKATNWNNKPLHTLTVSVRKDAPGKYRAYIPNRYVYTPPAK